MSGANRFADTKLNYTNKTNARANNAKKIFAQKKSNPKLRFRPCRLTLIMLMPIMPVAITRPLSFKLQIHTVDVLSRT